MLIYALEFYFFFFFQAEDGIRDRNVTGVQTCALPIFLCRGHGLCKRARRRYSDDALCQAAQPVARRFTASNHVVFAERARQSRQCRRRRSEERRVGKECRSRGVGGASKKREEKGSDDG